MMTFKQGFIPSLDGMAIVEASNGRIFLLGGHCISSVISYLAPNIEVYTIDFSTLSVQTVPQPAVDHGRDWQSLVWSCAAFGPSKDQIYMFGGRTISMVYSSDLRIFNISTGVWTTIRPRPENTTRPTARASATLTLLPNNKEFIIFGGRSRCVPKSIAAVRKRALTLFSCRFSGERSLVDHIISMMYISTTSNQIFGATRTHGAIYREVALVIPPLCYRLEHISSYMEVINMKYSQNI